MKIAVIGVKGLPPKWGSVEHYCAQVYPRMVAQGHSVDLFARSYYTNFDWLDDYDFWGVRVISLPSINLRGIDAFVTAALGAIAASATRYDIVHFYGLGSSLFTCLPKFTTSAKIVVTCQQLNWQRTKWGNLSRRLIRMREQLAVRFADEIIVISQELQSYFLQTHNRHTVYMPNAAATYPQKDAQKSVQLLHSWENITAQNLKLYKTLLNSSATIETSASSINGSTGIYPIKKTSSPVFDKTYAQHNESSGNTLR